MVEEFQAILDGTHRCYVDDVNEDGWCNEVVQPTLELALKISGGSSRGRRQWVWKSVKTSKLNGDFVPTLTTKSSTSMIDKKADFALTLPDLTDPAVGKIHERMGYEPGRGKIKPALSHIASSDSLSRLSLFSCVEVKRASEVEYKGGCNAAFWSAASVNMKHHLQSQMFPRPCLEISTTHHFPRGASALFTTNMTRARVGIDSHVQL